MYEPPRKAAELYEPPRNAAELYEPPRKAAELYDPPRNAAELYEPPRNAAELYEPPFQQSAFGISINQSFIKQRFNLENIRMNDREYVKLNTSIQTGSNAQHQNKDDEGNIEATIELRLPENLFAKNSGARKVDHVEMKPTKMRLSMENMPIAQLPEDLNLTLLSEKRGGALMSSCQLDVYPFSYTDKNEFLPQQLQDTVFPYYKQHTTTYTILIWYPDTEEVADELTTTNNLADQGFPVTNRFYYAFKKLGIIDFVDNHPLNLATTRNHEVLEEGNGAIYIRNIPTLEQILQNALQNAVSYASTPSDAWIQVYFVKESLLDAAADLTPPIDPQNKFEIEGYDEPLYYWTWDFRGGSEGGKHVENMLDAAFKPRVTLGQQSLTISYDTAPFRQTHIPILWNTSFVDTFEQPTQMTWDEIRKKVWAQPPPKRKYQYDVLESDQDHTYNFALNQVSCGVMNIIGNKTMRDTFSFLPWIPVNIESLRFPYKYHVKEYTQVNPTSKTQEDQYKFYFSYTDPTLSPYVQLLDFYDFGENGWSFHDPYNMVQDRVLPGTGMVYIFAVDRDEHPGSGLPDPSVRIKQQIVYSHEISIIDVGPAQSPLPALESNSQNMPLISYDETTSEYDSNDTSLEPGVHLMTTRQNVETVTTTDPIQNSHCDELVGTHGAVFTVMRWWNAHYNATTQQFEWGWEYGQPPEGEWENLNRQENVGPGVRIPVDRGSDDISLWTFSNPLEWAAGTVDPDTGHYINYYYQYCRYMRGEDQRPGDDDFVKPTEYENSDLWCYTELSRNGSSVQYTTTTTQIANEMDFQAVTDLNPGTQVLQPYDELAPNLRIEKDETFYILDGTSTQVTIGPQEVTEVTIRTGLGPEETKLVGNVRLSFTWDNLPMVVLSPVASIVLVLKGISVSEEIQPVNIPNDTRTGSSLTSVIPVVENYYSMATTLRDLHDELVVAREDYDNTPTYTMQPAGGQERTILLSAMYLTKDGNLRQIYIPPNGVFSVQLTFALSLYYIS